MHSEIIENLMLPCINKTFLGFECTGCGFQRSVLALSAGNFGEALLVFPAIYPLCLLVFLIFLSKFYKLKSHQKIVNKISLISIITIIISYTLKHFL